MVEDISRNRKPRLGAFAAAGVLAGAMVACGVAVPAFAHGYIGGSGSELTARQVTPGNTNLGGIQYEPQSLEATGGFPATGPADGHIASAGHANWSELDEQTSTRWVKNVVSPGAHTFGWTYTAPHNTDEWRYYITKKGWDPNAPLDRGDFELLQTVEGNGKPANTYPTHTINIPSDRTGYYVILAVWEVEDTANAFYNVVDVDIQPGGVAQPDTEAPSVPSGVKSTETTAWSVNLAWTASTDNKGVTGYKVERATGTGAFAKIADVSGTTFSDTGLSAATAYRYRVTAVDAAGNSSAASTVFSVTTAAGTTTDTQAPSAPAGVHSMETTSSSVDLMWTAATDDVGVTGYRVERATGSGAFAQVATPTGTSYLDSGLAAATAYRYRVTAVDAAGNASAASTVFSVTTAAATTVDTQAPSVPAGLKITATTSSSATLSWTASTDDKGVVGYRLDRATATGAFQQIAVVAGTTYQNTGLAASTTYRYRVSAVDAAGNVSAASAILSVTTPAATTNPGTYPTWNPKGSYTKGDKVTWNGKNYEAVQTHTGVGDANWIAALSLWKPIA
ncbi:lytic polysaccharide monooxygenase [Agromyces protaetiae]|uniref:lytic polysaccharide monooxygenase n=1 Tax=Agromyces protaetiae TaxID=2509455 RepID=UPI0013EB4EB2|nr:lytic polysaccharide monooxygenase [Agromyces protaetiae]